MARIMNPTLGAIASASMLVAVTSHAQSGSRSSADVLADLRACSTLARDGARLACFDGVLAAEGDGTPSSESPDRAPAPSAPPSVARARAASPEPASVAAAARGRGQDEAREEPDDDGRRPVTIVAINEMLSGEATFLTDTGQVYIQTSGRAPSPGSYPPLPYETTLRDGALGSLFLYLSERRRVRVRRAE